MKENKKKHIADKSAEIEKIVDEKEEIKNKKKEKESRTTETFFRNALRSNLDLTSLADSKASILISVNGFILTVMVTASGVYLSNPDMIYPFISIIVTALVSISLGAMAIHPRYKKELIEKDSRDKFSSVLYYQDMAEMHPDEYVEKVVGILKDKEETYTHIIKHFHILGTEIALKYKWLRRAYAAFALGLIVSTVFVIDSMIEMEEEMTLPTQFEKIFEPSGAISLSDGKVLLVEDENAYSMQLVKPRADNTLQELGKPEMDRKTKKTLKKEVQDVEGLTSNSNDQIFAITSHTTNKSRERKGAREQLVRFDYHDSKIGNVKLYNGLLNDFQFLHPKFKQALSDLKFGSRKQQINIEALAWDEKSKSLIIGLRSPLIDGKASIVILENPNEVFDEDKTPRLKGPILLDLEGLGIRGLTWDKVKKGYWISAGSVGARKKQGFGLWFWDKENNTVKKNKNKINLGFAEGLATLDDGRILVVNDDGSIATHGASYTLIDANISTNGEGESK